MKGCESFIQILRFGYEEIFCGSISIYIIIHLIDILNLTITNCWSPTENYLDNNTQLNFYTSENGDSS